MEPRNFKRLLISQIVALFVIILVTLGEGETASSLGTTVEISQGKLQGKILNSREGKEYLAFLNIPYASTERFQNPTAPKNWTGIYNATEMGPVCAQSMWVSYEKYGVEDCTSLNVYTKNVTGKQPTMVFFHGGGFTVGTANIYHAGYLLDQDVVLVVVNYRLGPFGFLSTSDDVILGNFGLKDQNMALQWVQENINKFGGDRDSVTIFGNSAGGASVNYHMLSPQSAGLFHAGISQSGSSLCSWAYSPKPKYMARKFGKVLNCSVDNSQVLLDCLLTKSTRELLVGQDLLSEWGFDPFTPFGPAIEPADNPSSFLTEDPKVLLKTGKFNKVPWMTGLVQDEGISIHAAYVLGSKDLTKELGESWRRIFPITLEFNEHYTDLSDAEKEAAAEEIYKYYFGNKSIGEETRQELTDMYSDRFFNYGVREAALLAAKHVPVYPYYFSHQRGDFTALALLNLDGNYGVAHADELSFLFSDVFDLAPSFQKGSVAERVSKNMVKLWTSFARNKKPTQLWDAQKSYMEAWKPVSASEINGSKPLEYYQLDTETTVIAEPFEKRLEFWTQLLTRLQALSTSEKRTELSIDHKDEL